MYSYKITNGIAMNQGLHLLVDKPLKEGDILAIEHHPLYRVLTIAKESNSVLVEKASVVSTIVVAS